MKNIPTTTRVTEEQPAAHLASSPVAVGDSVEPITLEEAKDHLRVVFDDEDDYIALLITAARQMAEGRLNRSLVVQPRRVVFDSGSTNYTLLKPPIVSIDAVYTIDATDVETPVEADQYRATYLMPRLAAAPGALWPSAVHYGASLVVEYTAGYAPGEVPKPIIMWMLAAIGTMYQQRESIVVGVSTDTVPHDYLSLLIQPYMVYE